MLVTWADSPKLFRARQQGMHIPALNHFSRHTSFWSFELDFQSQWCGLAIRLCHLVAVWCLPSYLTLLGFFYFLIFKWPLRTKRINRIDPCKALSTELGTKYTHPKTSNCHYQFPAMGGGRITANRRTIQRRKQLKLSSWPLKGCQLLHNLSLVINIFVTWKEAEFLSLGPGLGHSHRWKHHHSLMSSEKNVPPKHNSHWTKIHW